MTAPAEQPDFESSCLPHVGALLTLAMRISRDKIQAEDLVQETLLHAMEVWPPRSSEHIRAWLFTMLNNAFLDSARKHVRHTRITTTKLLAHAQATEVQPQSDDERLADEVIAALERLRPDLRAVVERVDLDGAQYGDAARVLGIPTGTVMSRLYRARRALEGALAEYAETEYGIRRSR